ncbi:MAG: tRNA (N6-isopentenyl adenosine(37)-C2)-methylthiotransferase MiaB [Suipraeoptans sp.]
MINNLDLKNILETIDISVEAPNEEPLRQYYFIKKATEYVKRKSEKIGRPLCYAVVTFGCQMNSRDSEKLEGILETIGYIKAPEEEADFVLFNTCTIRENANTKVYGRLGRLKPIKKRNPNMMIALCGCMMQESDEVEKFKKSYSFVDLIFGTHNVYKLAELMVTFFESKSMIIDVWEDTQKIVEDLPVDRKYAFKSGVNIMFGCNNYCTYCIVPYVRGRERSRSPEAIIKEITDLSMDGVNEIMLLGQNVNSYGKTLEKPITFAALLREVEKIPGIDRIRFMTSHPKDLSDELIETMKNSKKICKHLHLPLQSGSSRILEKMNRKYTKESYLEVAEKIKKAIPDISLTTDIIVGFPGETQEDFEDTLDVVRKVRYDSAFTFLYSKRSGTKAAVMEDQVDDTIAKSRFNVLLSEVQRISRQVTGVHVGQIMDALVEEINTQDSSLVTGRLSNNLLVHFKGDGNLIGKIVNVKLKECKGFYYLGELIE